MNTRQGARAVLAAAIGISVLAGAPVTARPDPFTVDGTLEGGAALHDGTRSYGGRATGALRLPMMSGLTIEARAGLHTLDRGEPVDRRRARSELRLTGGRERGVWAGAALERSFAGGPLPGAPLLSLGAWVPAGRVALGFSIEQSIERARIETLLPPESPQDSIDDLLVESRHVRATSTLVNARWEHRRVSLASVAGVTMNRYTSLRRWMQTSLDVAIKPRLALYATVGNPAPRWLTLDPGLGQRATFGLRLTGAPNAAAEDAERVRARSTALELKALGEGWYVIKVRMQTAGAVEVMGDFSSWQPVALRHVHGSQWALAVQLEPGVHHIQVRVDGGAWKPPDGIPGASDGFNGDVGVLVAR